MLTLAVCRQVASQAHVIWLDNFSKNFRMQLINISKAALRDALWTGVALREYAPDDVSLDIVHRRGFEVSAMPERPFADLHFMLQTLVQVTEDEGEMPHLYDSSLMRMWGVNSVPVTPRREKLPADTLAALRRAPDRLSNFYPTGLMKMNVGSNIGLARVMKQLLIDHGHLPVDPDNNPAKYMVMTVDINIFDRIIKVIYIIPRHDALYATSSQYTQMMYDMSGGGQRLRQYTSVSLAWWHSFKHGVGTIWRAFANTIWAPLWHRLYPSSRFYVKARGPQEASMHLLFMERAYPYFREELKEALTNEDVEPAGKAMLENILFLCEYAIPVVAAWRAEKEKKGWLENIVAINLLRLCF